MGSARLSLLMGSLSLAIAPALEVLMQSTLRQYQQRGATELATDTRMLLWWPWLMGAIGVGFLIKALLQAVAGRRQPRQPRSMRAMRRARRGPLPRLTAERRGARAPLQDPYRQACAVLGVPPGSNWAEIRSSWRRQLIHWHPDHGGDPDLWHQRVEAYEQLKAREERDQNAMVS
jgi:hypothetical protein